MLFKTLAGIGLFAAAGGAVGYSKILCATGDCAITGTPYGGAFFGGMLGFAIMSGVNSKPIAMHQPGSESDSDADSDCDSSESSK